MIISLKSAVRWFAFLSALLFSLLTIYIGHTNFFRGSYVQLDRIMRSIANNTVLLPDGTHKLLDFHIVDHWDKLPDLVKQQVKPTDVVIDQLFVLKQGVNIFGPPNQEIFLLYTENANRQSRYVVQLFTLQPIAGESHHIKPKKPVIEGDLQRQETIAAILNYVVPESLDPQLRRQLILPPSPHSLDIAFSLLVLLCGYFLLVQVMLRRLTKPVQKLAVWASGLEHDRLVAPAESFRYQELEQLSNIIAERFAVAKYSVEREQEFLSYVSHELRTPLAIAKSSTDVIKLAGQQYELPPIIGARLGQLEVAHNQMVELTETMLWLCRDEAILPVTEPVALHRLVNAICKEVQLVHPLKNGVMVKVNIDTYIAYLPVIPCKLVLINLIRNACMYTPEGGEIEIRQQGAKVTITNSCQTDQSVKESFGLGLQLVQKLVTKFSWFIKKEQSKDIYKVEVKF